MTLEQLRIFVAVAERLHMTRAAKALGLTQSAVSAAVAALEARYQTRLFDRIGRGLTLSEAGGAFLPEAKAVLARAASASLALEDMAGLRRGKISLYASQTIASYWLPPRMARFARAHPGVTLQLEVGNTAKVAQAVADGDVEFGFVEGEVLNPLLARANVGVDRLVILSSPSHPLSLSRRVSLNDLADAVWISREPGSGTRSAFEQALDRLGLPPERLNRILELPSNEAVLAAVAAGGALAAVSELAARPMIETVRLRRLAFELPERRFERLTHRARLRSRAGAAFVAALDDAPGPQGFLSIEPRP
jgi:DNA-binding transcriptional LysR family regulator